MPGHSAPSLNVVVAPTIVFTATALGSTGSITKAVYVSSHESDADSSCNATGAVTQVKAERYVHLPVVLRYVVSARAACKPDPGVDYWKSME